MTKKLARLIKFAFRTTTSLSVKYTNEMNSVHFARLAVALEKILRVPCRFTLQ